MVKRRGERKEDPEKDEKEERWKLVCGRSGRAESRIAYVG